jgi:large subunit ribosomal protein L25
MKLTAQKRTPGGAAALRQAERLPGVVYNSELNIPVSVELRAFDKAFREQGTSSLISLDIEGESHDVLVKQVQMNKRRREPLHVDFYAVTAGQQVEVHVPVEFAGTAAGVREGGQLDVHRREVLISVIPRLIPSHLELDVSELTIGDSFHIRDIASLLPAEAEVLDDEELTLVSVVPPRVEAEPEEEALEAEEPEVIGEGEEEEAESEEEE